jgi:hypothetical protein
VVEAPLLLLDRWVIQAPLAGRQTARSVRLSPSMFHRRLSYGVPDPLWLTEIMTAVDPANLTLAVRDPEARLRAAVTVKDPEPEPVDPAVIVSQGTEVVTVHAQPEPAVMLRVLDPPLDPKEKLLEDTLWLHGAGPLDGTTPLTSPDGTLAEPLEVLAITTK